MSDEPMLPGRSYLMKIGTSTVGLQVTKAKYRIDVNSLDRMAAQHLSLNEIGVCTIALDRPVPFDPYADNRTMGSFIVIDRLSNNTVGAGMLHFALRRAHNIHPQPLDVSKSNRASIKGQRAAVLWFTGLSGARNSPGYRNAQRR